MNNKRLTAEQMLSIERWENEGGRISVSQGVAQSADHALLGIRQPFATVYVDSSECLTAVSEGVRAHLRRCYEGSNWRPKSRSRIAAESEETE